MSDLLSRFYTTTAGPDDRRVRDGCGHLHPQADRAVACALRRGDYPVTVDRAGKSVLPMDQALDAALAAALGTAGGGGVAGRLVVRARRVGKRASMLLRSRLSEGGVQCQVPR